MKQDLADNHITSTAMNTKLIEKTHDKGTLFSVKMFLESNVNVDNRPGKVRLDSDGTTRSFQNDYVFCSGFSQKL